MNLFGFFYLTFYTVEINNNLTQLQQYNNIYNYTNNFFTLIRDDASFKLKQTIARKKHVFNNYNNLKNLVKEGESDNPMFNDYTNDCNTMFFNSKKTFNKSYIDNEKIISISRFFFDILINDVFIKKN